MHTNEYINIIKIKHITNKLKKDTYFNDFLYFYISIKIINSISIIYIFE